MITKAQASRLRGLVARSAETAKWVGQKPTERHRKEANKAREAVYAYIRELEKPDGRTDPPDTSG